MPRIFDNLTEDTSLLLALRDALAQSYRADICVGYFNLRGWRPIAPFVDTWPGGEGAQARLLIGMQRPPVESVRRAYTQRQDGLETDLQTVFRLKQPIAQDFRDQLTIGVPTNADEDALRALSAQHARRQARRPD